MHAVFVGEHVNCEVAHPISDGNRSGSLYKKIGEMLVMIKSMEEILPNFLKS